MTQPKEQTPEALEKIGSFVHNTISQEAAETLLGETLRRDVGEYRITSQGRDLRIEYYAPTRQLRAFWAIWAPIAGCLKVVDYS